MAPVGPGREGQGYDSLWKDREGMGSKASVLHPLGRWRA